MQTEVVPVPGFERVLRVSDDRCGYRAFISLHSMRAGPAIGGTRMLAYAHEQDALEDALALSECMTRKTLAAGLPVGGGKAVIMQPPEGYDRIAIMKAHGRAVEALHGAYITAVDSGTSGSDLHIMATETRHVTSMKEEPARPAAFTALGVLRAIQAAVEFVHGGASLRGVRVAVQGCGAVGAELARQLYAEGAHITASDLDESLALSVKEFTGATTVKPDEILFSDVDVLAPCALGGVITERVAQNVTARIVAGAANNQLERDDVAEIMFSRGITYVPDFYASAGGVISGCGEYFGWRYEDTCERVNAIGSRTEALLRNARDQRSSLQACARANVARMLEMQRNATTIS